MLEEFIARKLKTNGDGKKAPFYIKRPLADTEKKNQLKRDLGCSPTPKDFCSVIKINSVYLELIDRYYIERGELTFIGLAFVPLSGVAIILLVLILGEGYLWQISTKSDDLGILFGFIGILVLVVSILAFWICLESLFTECFKWTHNPIRLNRKTGMVYVFRLNGTILAVPWDNIFFTLHKTGGVFFASIEFGGTTGDPNYDIRGHILAEDGETVKETFALSYFDEDSNNVYSFWEFVRRYMEEGPQSLPPVEHYVNDATPARFGLGFFRFLANLTCKAPVWPDWVEKECEIEADDPYKH